MNFRETTWKLSLESYQAFITNEINYKICTLIMRRRCKRKQTETTDFIVILQVMFAYKSHFVLYLSP